jgi:hypothetical protein
MKKIILAVLLFNLALVVKAQDEKEERTGGFKKENLFTGGSLNFSFFNGTTGLGVNPYFGYSITNWLDVAASFNFNYISQRDVDTVGDKVRQTVLAPGAFVRVFPVNFLFAEAKFEHNFIRQKYVPYDNYNRYKGKKFRTDMNSLLLGIGYASGREGYNKSYYYISISFDVLQLAHSPYVDNLQRTLPIYNAGFNIALFQGRGRR